MEPGNVAKKQQPYQVTEQNILLDTCICDNPNVSLIMAIQTWHKTYSRYLFNHYMMLFAKLILTCSCVGKQIQNNTNWHKSNTKYKKVNNPKNKEKYIDKNDKNMTISLKQQ